MRDMIRARAAVLKAALLAGGVLLGGWYAWCAAFGIFSASEREAHNPFFWIAMLCPCSSLLAVLLGFGNPQLAGRWLIGAGVLSALAATLIADSPLETLGATAALFTLPMATLGYGFLVLGRQATSVDVRKAM